MSDEIRWIVEGSLYLLVSIGAASKAIYLYKSGASIRKNNGLVILFTFVALILRGVWMIERGRPDRDIVDIQISFAVNRFALFCTFFSFIIVAVEWASLWTTLSGRSPRVVRVVCGIATTVLFLIQVYSVILYITAWRLWSSVAIIKFDIIAIQCSFFLLGLGFYFYGAKFARQLQAAACDTLLATNQSLRQTMRKVNMVASVCALCFGLRCFFWIFGSLIRDYKVIEENETLKNYNLVVYPTLFYTVFEIIPSLALLHVLVPHHKQNGEWPNSSLLSDPASNDANYQRIDSEDDASTDDAVNLEYGTLK